MKITGKIVISLSIILLLGALSMLIIFYGLKTLENAIHNLTHIKEPTSAAAYEMEINILGIAMGVLKYLDHPDDSALQQVRGDEQDFERFHSHYLALAATEKEKSLGRRMTQSYGKFKTLAEDLIQKRDVQATILTRLSRTFDAMDRVLDERIEPNIDHQAPRGHLKQALALDLEADLAELSSVVANYRASRGIEERDLIATQEQEFRQSMTNFKKLSLNSQERQSAIELEETFNETMSLIHESLFLDAYFQEQSRKFISLRSEIDQILDEEIQILTKRELNKPKSDADRAATWVITMIQFLIPLFLISAAFVGFLLVRGIREPVKKLMTGTHAIGRGEWGHRIDVKGKDEFTDLGRQFNDMVDRLEATTVSKTRLEASEAKLKETVIELRREIVDREQAEHEQLRLQAALRRNEIMAAMGSLVAGVAHEARNPLFAVSSVIDALEARLTKSGVAENYNQHLTILRTELTRLSKLMWDLLEYGKPSELELVAGTLDKVIVEAIEICTPQAHQNRVMIQNQMIASRLLVKIDRTQLVQVFKNLIENAVQHSSPESSVIIQSGEFTRNEESWIECWVKDSGPGFAPEDLPHIFEPFFSRRHGGTGLGLSIVERIVERHHGKISARNGDEGGAIITVRLPAVQAIPELEDLRAKESLGR